MLFILTNCFPIVDPKWNTSCNFPASTVVAGSELILTGHRIEVPYQYFVTGAYVNLLFQHTVQRLQAEGPSIPLSHCPGSSPIGVFGGFLSSSGSSPSIADVSSSPPTVIVVFISSHVPTFLSTCAVCSLGHRSRRITDNEPVWSSPPSLGITEAKSARIPAIVDACPP
eukprot:g50841.t1